MANGNPADQDPTFDLSYAAGGSVVIDATQPPGNLLLAYEGTNTCVGITTATNPSSGAYIADTG